MASGAQGIGIAERMDDPNEQQKAAIENEMAQMHVAIPGIIESFDAASQTASVQPAIMEDVKIGADDTKPTNLPLLTQVPVQFPRAGGYSITFPVQKGDECLVVFGDSCIDGWWQSGGVQQQMETRRHDLSDAMAILGITSTGKVIGKTGAAFSTGSMQIRSDDGGTYIELAGENINIKATKVTIDGELEVTGETIISGIAFTPHVHGGIVSGGDKTAPPEKG